MNEKRDGQCFGGNPCENNCIDYAWCDGHLQVVEKDFNIDTGLTFFNEYKGHHPSCANYKSPANKAK